MSITDITTQPQSTAQPLTIVECEPEVGKLYFVHYNINIFSVQVERIFHLSPSGAKIVECIDLETGDTIRLLANHRNCAIFFRSIPE